RGAGQPPPAAGGQAPVGPKKPAPEGSAEPYPTRIDRHRPDPQEPGQPVLLQTTELFLRPVAHHFCRRSTRRIFPLTVFGSSVTKAISRGYLYGAVVRLTNSWSSSPS